MVVIDDGSDNRNDRGDTYPGTDEEISVNIVRNYIKELIPVGTVAFQGDSVGEA